jgi:TolA-binding protein
LLPRHPRTSVAFLLAVLFALSGCNGHKGRQALREGTVAELQGDWELARHKYAEACTLENGEAFRKLADLSLRKDTESLLADDCKDEEWSRTAHELAQRIARIGHEAARRGFPVEVLDAKLAAFDTAIETSLEKAREAERAAREAARLAEERRREAERLAEERRKAEQARAELQSEANTLERQIRELERELEDCNLDLKEVEDRANAERSAVEMYLLENRRYFSGNDAYRMGQELALKYKGEMDRIKIHKKRLESELFELRQKRTLTKRKLNSFQFSNSSGEDLDSRRDGVIQSNFADMGGDALVKASDQVVQDMNEQQESVRQVLNTLAGESSNPPSPVSFREPSSPSVSGEIESDRNTKRTLEVRRAQMLVKEAEERTGNARNELLDEAVKICNALQWGGLDVQFVDSVVVLANVELARGNRAEALNILAKNMDIIKPIDDSLEEMDLSMKDSPMAGARSLLGRIFKEDADAVANDPSKTEEAIKLYSQALTEYYNVFIKYGDSSWGPTAGIIAQEIKNILEREYGKTVKINLPNQAGGTEFAMADNLFRQQRYEEAAAEYIRVLDQFSDEGDLSVTARAQLLLCYMNLDRPLEAKKVADELGARFAKKSPIVVKALVTAGALYDKKQDATMSKYMFDVYLKYFPDDARADKILFWLASKAETAGRMDEANTYYSKLISDYPNSQYYSKASSKLRRENP